ncbi:MAG: arsenic efflux protein [Clostridia bacterium]|nr:arsenic efflux protein [Clostridia bacterium]
MGHALLHALLDSLKVFPFLILLYIIIEVVEEKVSTSKHFVKYTNGKYATVVGAGLGLIPQCGFSVVASDLYSKRYIKMGTMLAIFIATSDEALPIILSNPEKAYLIFPMLAIKFVYALIVGYGVDFVANLIYKKKTVVEIVPPAEHEHEHEHEHEDTHEDEISGCCGHNVEGKRNTLKKFFVHPLIHSLKIFVYIFIVNAVLEVLIHYLGEEAIVNFMQSVTYLQPLIVPLVGLIPNCASSVLITQLLIIDGITFGSAVAGLCVNAGIGLAVLFKQNKNIKQNLSVLAILYLSSVALGYIITLIETLII